MTPPFDPESAIGFIDSNGLIYWSATQPTAPQQKQNKIKQLRRSNKRRWEALLQQQGKINNWLLPTIQPADNTTTKRRTTSPMTNSARPTARKSGGMEEGGGDKQRDRQSDREREEGREGGG